MEQSTLLSNFTGEPPGLHVAIIMDGNGRWAEDRGLARQQGHCAGAEALRSVVEAAPGLGVRNLTVFAFSSDNWKRPEAECDNLFSLFEGYLHREGTRSAENGVEVRGIGFRHRLPASLRQALSSVEKVTARGSRLCLRIAIDYSSRVMLSHAASLCGSSTGWPPSPHTRQVMDYALATAYGHPGRRMPPVDLLIRTGGEQRLSDFLLWECAYAELWFTPTLWPDFNGDCLGLAIHDFVGRTRTYGALTTSQASDAVISMGWQQ